MHEEKLILIEKIGLTLFLASALLVAGWITRVLSTLFNLYKAGIPILFPSLEGLWGFLDGNTLHLFDYLSILLRKYDGVVGWFSPVGKPFVIISDESVLSQLIVQNQSKLTKHHAFGILEIFRKTHLHSTPDGKGDAWKVVHRIASKFPILDKELQGTMRQLLERYMKTVPGIDDPNLNSLVDFAEYTRQFYWDFVLLLVTGEIGNESLGRLYQHAWRACIKALCKPGAHMFQSFASFPLPVMREYKSLTKQLRSEIMKRIDAKNSPPWTVLSLIQNEMSRDDQLEVAMEFLFTGASSVTTSLIWLMWHISRNDTLQDHIRHEAQSIIKSRGSNTFPSESDNNWLNDDEVVHCTILESALRETLRLYSPIHIGRLSLEEITLKTNKGQIVTIPKGTDLFCNMWFIHRNESKFFLKKLLYFWL